MVNPVILLMGPTASGKTAISLAIAQHLPIEIISVDSTMVYRNMDIGSAKPDKSILKKVPHHLIDIRDPNEPYSVADFCEDANSLIIAIQQRNKIPLLVGGTMLYFNQFTQGLSKMPKADDTIRAQILSDATKTSWQAQHLKLASIDPASARVIHPNDTARVTRALEVYYLTGKTRTALFQAQKSKLEHDFIALGIQVQNREILHNQIKERFIQMIERGFIQEVKALFERGDLHENLPALRSVGYRQVWSYLKGELEKKEMIDRGISATRQVAKRQMTWLRKWPNLTWIVMNNIDMDKLIIDLNQQIHQIKSTK